VERVGYAPILAGVNGLLAVYVLPFASTPIAEITYALESVTPLYVG